MDNTTLSAADVALLSRNDGFGGGFGDGGGIWLFALLFLFMAGGNGGFFGNGNQQFATRDQVQNGFDTQNMQMQTSGILNAVTNGTAQTIAASTANATNAINAIKDGNAALIREFGNVETALTALSGKQQECCCNIQNLVQSTAAATDAQIARNNYDAAMRDAATNANITAQVQSIKDMMYQQREAAQAQRIQQLELAQATSGLLRFPNQWTFNGGFFPPMQCGCGCNA